jgi:hypothetical protein
MVSADHDYVDPFIVQEFELFSYKGTGAISRQDSIVKVACYEQQVWWVLYCIVDYGFKASLKVSFPIITTRPVVDCSWV